MDLKDILAVSGLPGLYNLVATRNNGLFVSDIDTGKKIFCSMRKYQFTPLETVSIYTMSDSTEVKEIFKTMLAQISTNPPAKVNGSNQEITTYFASILPDYDEDRVYVSDMKKVIKWFNFLNERGFLKNEENNTEEE